MNLNITTVTFTNLKQMNKVIYWLWTSSNVFLMSFLLTLSKSGIEIFIEKSCISRNGVISPKSKKKKKPHGKAILLKPQKKNWKKQQNLVICFDKILKIN